MSFEQDRLVQVREEAAVLSMTEGVAVVVRLPNGRLIATTTSTHLIPGKTLATYIRGVALNV